MNFPIMATCRWRWSLSLMARFFSIICLFFVCVSPSLSDDPDSPGNGKTKVYNGIQEILDAMPRKPEPRDNVLAASESNGWLKQYATGNRIRVSGKVFGVDDRNLGIQPQNKRWRDYNFNFEISAPIQPRYKTDRPWKREELAKLSRILPEDTITIEGTVTEVYVAWRSFGDRSPNSPHAESVYVRGAKKEGILGTGSCNLKLSNCTILSSKKPTSKKPQTNW